MVECGKAESIKKCNERKRKSKVQCKKIQSRVILNNGKSGNDELLEWRIVERLNRLGRGLRIKKRERV